MVTVQARPPKEEAVRIKERAAKRKMTGVTLQYTDDDRVFFEDVAGIGDAKVESAALLSSPVLRDMPGLTITWGHIC